MVELSELQPGDTVVILATVETVDPNKIDVAVRFFEHRTLWIKPEHIHSIRRQALKIGDRIYYDSHEKWGRIVAIDAGTAWCCEHGPEYARRYFEAPVDGLRRDVAPAPTEEAVS